MRLLAAMTAVTAPIGFLVLTTTPATALSVTQTPNTVTLNLTQAEAQAITAANLGPLLGALPPNFTPEARQRLAENISHYAARAAQTPGATLTVIINQPVTTPPAVSVTVTR